MPDPRELGYVAKAVIQSVIAALDANQDGFFDAAVAIHTDEERAALDYLKAAARRNSMSLRALTLLIANKQHEAEDVVLDSKIKAQAQARAKTEAQGK